MRFLIGCLVALAACGTSDPEMGDAFLHYDTSGGFSGAGHGSTLDVEDTGRATLTYDLGGYRALDVRSDMATLRTLVDDAGFPSLQPHYMDANREPESFTYAVTAYVDGASYEVVIDEGVLDAIPQPLAVLIVRLQTMADVPRS